MTTIDWFGPASSKLPGKGKRPNKGKRICDVAIPPQKGGRTSGWQIWLGWRNGLWNRVRQKNWFIGVALRTCISLVPRGSLREGIPDTSLKGVRRRDFAVEQVRRVVATGEERYTERTTVALIHNPRGWLGEIRPESGMGSCRVGTRSPSCLAYLHSCVFLPALLDRYHRLSQ